MSKSSNHDGSSDLGLDDDNECIISFGSTPAKPNKPNPKEAKWDIGDSVLVKYNDTKFYYEAKIIGVTKYDDQPSYIITYPGWGSNYNEEVIHEEAIDRFIEFTEENRRKARDDIAQASGSQSKKRKSRVSGASNNSFNSSEFGGGSSSKKPKNGNTESPSVTDSPVSSFKSVSQKIKPKSENKLPSVKMEKKLPSPEVDKKLASPKVEKKQQTPKADKRHPTPKVEKKQHQPSLKLERKQPSPKFESVKQASPKVVKELRSPREIKPISLTEKLNKIFLEDRQLVVEEDMLPKLPADFPVKTIMEQYVDSLDKSLRKEGMQFSQIILSRFQPNTVALNVYMFEVAMLEDLLVGKSGFEGLRSKELEKEDTATGIPKDFTLLFGVAYILRLLANFHIIAAKDSLLTHRDLDLFADSAEKFVKFLDDYSDEHFKGEKGYYPASVMYCTREESCE